MRQKQVSVNRITCNDLGRWILTCCAQGRILSIVSGRSNLFAFVIELFDLLDPLVYVLFASFATATGDRHIENVAEIQ